MEVEERSVRKAEEEEEWEERSVRGPEEVEEWVELWGARLCRRLWRGSLQIMRAGWARPGPPPTGEWEWTADERERGEGVCVRGRER